MSVMRAQYGDSCCLRITVVLHYLHELLDVRSTCKVMDPILQPASCYILPNHLVLLCLAASPQVDLKYIAQLSCLRLSWCHPFCCLFCFADLRLSMPSWK